MFDLHPFGLVEVFFGDIELSGLVSGCQKAVVSDTDKAMWQDMRGKSPEEFNPTKCCLFLFSTFTVVFVIEAYCAVIYIEQPMVGDSYLVGISAQVLNHCIWRSKRPFGIDNPFLFKSPFTDVVGYVDSFPQLGHKPGTENFADCPFGI